MFRDNSIVSRCFWSFILPVLEYFSSVWMSAAVSHLPLLDWVVRRYLGLVVLKSAVICGTDAELPLCLCFIVFVFLLVIRWDSYFLSCSRPVVLPAIILLCTPSLLCALDVAPRTTRVCLFLLVFRQGICLISRTSLAMVLGPSRHLWIVP